MSEGPIRVAAEPYAGEDRQKATFGRSLDSAGIFPVLLLVENASDHPVLLRRAWISLETSGETRNAEESASRADALLRAEHLEWNKAVGAYGGLGYGSVDLGLGYLLGSMLQPKKKPNPSEWQLPAVLTLAPQERARGFVYFARPRGSRAGILRIDFGDPATSSTPDKQVELLLDDDRAVYVR